MKVKLSYFKASGKWYSDGEYETDRKELFMIWQDVQMMCVDGRLPGLIDGANEFIVLVDVPEHENNHPHLVNTLRR